MSERYPASGDSTSGKPALLSPSSSSTKPSSCELQPYSQSHLSSPSNQSSIVVPVRLDVLLFLLNSAARGAQYALPPVPVQGDQRSPSTCHHGPTAQRGPNGGGCSPTCQSFCQPSGTHPYGGDYSRCVRGMESHDGRDGSTHRRDGKSWPAASSAGGWKIPQERPRGEGRGRDNGDSWQGRQQNFGRSWGDRRHSGGDSSSWRSGSQDWRKEGSAFRPNYTNNKRTQEGCLRPPWDAPDAKRPMDDAGMSWLKGQGTKESTSFQDKPAGDGPGKAAAQENGEDWETDYAGGQTSPASCSDVPGDLSKAEDCASPAEPPTLKLLPSPLPEMTAQTQAVAAAAAAEPPTASCLDQSKSGGFVSYIKNFYSDLPRKSSSEGSSDLVIDTDVESSKPDEEQSPDNEVGGELKSWE